MSNWWVSWYCPSESMPLFELHSPWWVSGYAFEPDRHIVVAAIRADSEESVWEKVRSAFDTPVEIEERFIEPVPHMSEPFSDRFPKASWMAWDEDRTCACSACTEQAASDG
jgi:hypothetical protein